MDGAFPSAIQITSKEKPQKGGVKSIEGASRSSPTSFMGLCADGPP